MPTRQPRQTQLSTMASHGCSRPASAAKGCARDSSALSLWCALSTAHGTLCSRGRVAAAPWAQAARASPHAAAPSSAQPPPPNGGENRARQWRSCGRHSVLLQWRQPSAPEVGHCGCLLSSTGRQHGAQAAKQPTHPRLAAIVSSHDRLISVRQKPEKELSGAVLNGCARGARARAAPKIRHAAAGAAR